MEFGFYFIGTEEMLQIFEERLKKIWTVLYVDDSGYSLKGKRERKEAGRTPATSSKEKFDLYKQFFFILLRNTY